MGKKKKFDLVALQELRTEQLPIFSKKNNYNYYFNLAKYHGTAIFSKVKPINIKTKLNYKRFDDEKRFLEFEFEDFIFINVYMPHGSRDKKNLSYKLKAYDYLLKYISGLKKAVILAGDFNIAHTENDLARPKQNKKNTMFTPEERRKIDSIINQNFIDAFRQFQNDNTYTWWLRAFNAKERNIGWRLDYIFVSSNLKSKIKSCRMKDPNFSDHASLVLNLDI